MPGRGATRGNRDALLWPAGDPGGASGRSLLWRKNSERNGSTRRNAPASLRHRSSVSAVPRARRDPSEILRTHADKLYHGDIPTTGPVRARMFPCRGPDSHGRSRARDAHSAVAPPSDPSVVDEPASRRPVELSVQGPLGARWRGRRGSRRGAGTAPAVERSPHGLHVLGTRLTEARWRPCRQRQERTRPGRWSDRRLGPSPGRRSFSALFRGSRR